VSRRAEYMRTGWSPDTPEANRDRASDMRRSGVG